MILTDDDGVPFGWEDVPLTESELEEMCDAADVGNLELADAIVERAYDRLFGETLH